MKPILEIQNISKKFRIQHENQPYLSLRDSLTSVFKKKTSTSEEFYALKDVSFTVNPGESVGIIGRNGAGKSTLLKILSSITPPSSGRIITRGRIASLLEVGTGFHPELTGRENVFLNGSILGMRRHEILKNFDAIVDFAGVEKFIDTPLKHYSSGMQLRLAFAVAAFLENEILIIDEVLAVGDAEFQKKCMGKMEEVSKNDGKTVLFVSHNMLAVKSLCQKGILLVNGEKSIDGNLETVMNKYITEHATISFTQINRSINGFWFESIEIKDNGISGHFDLGKDLEITIHTRTECTFNCVNVNLFFKSVDGAIIFATCSKPEPYPISKNIYKCVIPANTLNDVIYIIDLMVVENSVHLLTVPNALVIEGEESYRDGGWFGKFPGLIRPTFYKWQKINIYDNI